MPYVDYGEEFATSQSQFIKLKSKGDKVHFRLLGRPFVEGKHFFQNENGEWEIKPCPRVNDGMTCEFCETYYKEIAKAKATGDKAVLEDAKKKFGAYKAGISFYFPVIDRKIQEFGIFQTTISVRNKIETEVELGTKVMETDFVVLRTEKPGENYYTLSRVDSADVKPLTAKEKEEAKKYKTLDLASIVSGTREEDSNIAIQENTDSVEF